MKTRLAALAAALCAATLAAAPLAQAASATTTSAGDPATARWSGTFDTEDTVTRNDFSPESVGRTVESVHTVASDCSGRTQCPSITLTRRATDGRKRTMTLRVIGDGQYQGSISYRSSWPCSDSDGVLYRWKGRMTESLVVEATGASRRAGVTSYTGTLDLTFPAYRETADVPEVCTDLVRERFGWRDGYKPRQQYEVSATRR